MIKADPSLSAAANALPTPAQSAPVVASKPKSKPPRAAESDAAMAARLQAEESLRARPTRGGVVKKRAPSAKEKKAAKVRLQKASRAKSGSGSDSNLSELEDGEPKKRNGAFHVSYSVFSSFDDQPAISCHGPIESRPVIPNSFNRNQ